MVAKGKTPVPSAISEDFDHDELLALARLDMEKGDLSNALWKLKQVTASDKAPPEAFSQCGRLYAQLGLWNRAQQMFQTYLGLDPKAVTETFQLGMVHLDAGRPADALKIIDGLLKQHATHPPALFYRALILAQQGQTTQARQALEVLLKSAPVDNLYFGRGKELSQNLAAQSPSLMPRAATAELETQTVLAKDAYKTEH